MPGENQFRRCWRNVSLGENEPIFRSCLAHPGRGVLQQDRNVTRAPTAFPSEVGRPRGPVSATGTRNEMNGRFYWRRETYALVNELMG